MTKNCVIKVNGCVHGMEDASQPLKSTLSVPDQDSALAPPQTHGVVCMRQVIDVERYEVVLVSPRNHFMCAPAI